MGDWTGTYSAPIWLSSDDLLKGVDNNDLIRIGIDGDYRLIHKAKGHFDGNANTLGALCINVGKDDAFGICSSNENGPGQNALLEVKGGNGNLFVKGDLNVTGIEASSIVKAPGLHINGAATIEKGLTVGSAPTDMLDVDGAIRFNNFDGSKIQLISEKYLLGESNFIQIGSSGLDSVNIETNLNVSPDHRIIIKGQGPIGITAGASLTPVVMQEKTEEEARDNAPNIKKKLGQGIGHALGSSFLLVDPRLEISKDSIDCYGSGLTIGAYYGGGVTIDANLFVKGNIKIVREVHGTIVTFDSIDISDKLDEFESRIAALENPNGNIHFFPFEQK